MAERIIVYALDGAISPMLSFKLMRRHQGATEVPIGTVKIEGKTKEEVAKEIAEIILNSSPALQKYFDGHLTLKQRLVKRFGFGPGGFIANLLMRNANLSRGLASARAILKQHNIPGSICAYCGTYHPELKKVIYEQDGKVFCNPGCKDQFNNGESEKAELGFDGK